MTEDISLALTRDEIGRMFPGNYRAQAAYEAQTGQVVQTVQTVEVVRTDLNDTIAATDTIRAAAFLTLSPNAELTDEYVFTPGSGLSGSASPGAYSLGVDSTVARTTGGFVVTFTATAATNLSLPASGFVVTRDAAEELSNKTLDKLRLEGAASTSTATASHSIPVEIGGSTFYLLLSATP